VNAAISTQQDDEDRKRYDADLEIDDRPPALGPESVGRALSAGPHALDVLHRNLPGLAFGSSIPADDADF